MSIYWGITIIIISSLLTMFLCSKYAIELKHSYDENWHPKFIINEPEVYVVGFIFGSMGMLISYISFSQIRKEDSLNSYRFLSLTLLFLAIHATIITLLICYGFITF